MGTVIFLCFLLFLLFFLTFHINVLKINEYDVVYSSEVSFPRLALWWVSKLILRGPAQIMPFLLQNLLLQNHKHVIL